MKKFSCGLAAWVAVAGSAAFAATVENDSLAVTFAENDVGKGRVLQIVAKKTGQKFIGAPRALWQIECRRLDDYTQKKIVDAMAAKSVSYARVANGLVIEYRDVDVCVAEMVCRITADPGDGLIHWHFAATPKAGWAVYETDYPSVYLTPSIGESPEDDCVVTGDAKGGVVRNPMDPKREYWKNRHYQLFPGRLVSTFGAFYDPKGGLYTDVVDEDGNCMGLLMDRWWRHKLPDGTFKEGDFLLEWRHFEFSSTTYKPSYDVTMGAFAGRNGAPTGWRDAADIYRERTKDCYWNRVKLIDRPDVPAWAKNGPVQIKFNRSWFGHPGLIDRWVREYYTKRFPGVPFVATVEGWEHHGDWVTPEYFPCYPSDEAFRRMCASLRKADGHVWAWPGGHHWNVRVGKRQDGTYRLDYTDLFNRKVRPFVCANPDGSPHFASLGWLGGGDSATLCPATDYGRDWWNDFVACGLVSRGVGLVQADQDVGAKVQECWSRDHGHAPGMGRWMTKAMRRQFETQLSKTREIDPWAQFSFEEPNERYNDMLCFQDYRNCRFFGSEWASVFNYLHHEYITPYQPGSEFYSKWYWIAHSAADGQMPRLPERPEYFFEMPAVENGSFENPQLGLSGYAGWFGTRDGQTIVTNDATHGVYSLGVITSEQVPVIDVHRTLPDVVAPGQTCKVTAQMKLLRANATFRGALRIMDGDGKKEIAQVVPDAEPNVWKLCEATFVVPEGVRRLRLKFAAKDGAAYLVDDVRLLRRTAKGDFEEVRYRMGREQLDFAERWIDVYHANAKWLQHGRHLHPPKITCERLPYTEKFRGRVAQLEMPSVFVGAFRSADGEDALFMVNATDREQKFTLEWEGRALVRTLPARGLKFERVAKKKPVDVMCVYYPHWHRYPKGDEWFGADNWKQGEWAYVKTAKPRFAGHNQPLVPYGGFRDESDPEQMAVDIALAANAGIDVFLYDYYYYNGQITQEDALEKGFLGAANRNRMKFALMWCYHERNNQFRVKSGEPRVPLMSLAHTPEEFLGLIDLSVARYFHRPEYYRKDGKLFFSVYNAPYFLKCVGTNEVRTAIAEARRRVRAAGLGELHLNAQNARAEQSAALKDVGFDSLTHYGNNPWMVDGFHRKFVLEKERIFDYSWVVEGAHRTWAEMRTAELPYIPSVLTGWDSTPRCRDDEPFPWKNRDYPYIYTLTNNTPDAVQAHLAAAKAYAESDPRQPGIVYINGWNEYTEGSFLIPNNFTADGLLRAVAAVFGRKPADEYTYINPSSGKLLTVPAATHENVAYGSHAKQKVDLWLPPSAAGKVPLLIYVHGGGWGGGAMCDAIIGPKIRTLLDRGVAVACVGYRYLRETERGPGIPPVKGCVDDVSAAIRFLKSRSDAWGIDVSRIGLAGGSAGACTALILAYRNGNDLGIRALAPIVPQTSMDPAEMREWIPNSTYGARAFGYRSFDDWLAHRDEHPEWIAAYSPAALARRIDPAKAPRVILRAPQPKSGELPKDPTHAAAFSWRFAEICRTHGLPCDIQERGDALLALADVLRTH